MKNVPYVLFLLLSVSLVSHSYAQFPNAEAYKNKGNNYAHRPNTIIKKETDSLVVHVQGEGYIPVILIPGHMQYETLYKNFVERNKNEARFYIAIPPGMGGTPAYPWPEEAEEFTSRPWSTQFENELVGYIDRNISDKPYLVVNWYSGLGMALHIADRYPEKIRGIIFVGPVVRSPFYRWYRPDSTNADMLFDAKAQRKALAQFIEFWRNVDEHTWHSNMFSPNFYSNDETLGLKVVYQEAKHSMPISLRYFAEYAMDDLSQEIQNLSVPAIAIPLIPGKETLGKRLRARRGNNITADQIEQSYESTKSIAIRDWQTEKNDSITLEFIEDSGLLVWDDKPDEFDRIFRKFISQFKAK